MDYLGRTVKCRSVNFADHVHATLQAFVDRIPEPAAASPPEWIKLGNSYINLRHVVSIELTDKFAYDFRFANGEMRRVDVREQDASVHNTESFIMGPWVLRDQS